VELEIAPGLDHQVGKHVGSHVVQALREMLSNVARHAAANEARVRVSVDEDRVTLSVRDDGVGFAGPPGVGRGLRNLTSRARELGGECVIDSAPGRGTLVTWTAYRLD
jgi:signal transduction histidine kinase